MPLQKRIVILGAGFAGLRLARELDGEKAYEVTLVDKNNYHQFQPLFYQVATASLDASNISFPTRNIFRKSPNIHIRVADIQSIDVKGHAVQTSAGRLPYDFLVIATGADTNYFNNEEVKQNAFPMKSTWEALQLRNQLLSNFEKASISTDEQEVERLLNIVIVGGGPTGIELGGALAEMRQFTLPEEYPETDFSRMNIYLLERSPKVLANMSEASSQKANKYLQEMGIHVRTGTGVKNYDGKNVLLHDDTQIPAELVIWAAGVTGNLPAGLDQTIVAPGNRIDVDAFNRVSGSTDIFALGDIAFMHTEKYPKGLPQLASVAIDQARHLARNFKRMEKSKALKEFVYHNKGTMATVGRKKAVVDLETPRVSFQGFFAWIVWMTLHLFLLIGFKNRLVVFINWIYKYFTRSQSLSLLFRPLVRKN